VRTASGLSAFVANLGAGIIGIRAERRITPLAAEVGLTDRLSIGVMVPLVRVDVRKAYVLDTTGNLGHNPLVFEGADATYAAFFGAFDSSLTQLDQYIAANCPANPSCGTAQNLSTEGHAMRLALGRVIYGTGPTGRTPFIPLNQSAAGQAIDTTIAQIQRELADSFSIAGFTQSLLLPTARASGDEFSFFLADSAFGINDTPLDRTNRGEQYWLGDAEVSAKYRVIAGDRYAAAAALVLRLPTGHLASPNDPFGVSTGDHQTDVEGRLIQEWTLGGRLWLNLNVRGGIQLAGQRERRVAPPGLFWVTSAADARLSWKPGNYLGADFAPMYRFTPTFAAGAAGSYYTQRADRYAFRSAADSTALAARLGVPTSASVLDAGTGIRFLRLGLAVTYTGPRWEAGFSVLQTVSGGGAAVPASTVFRIVLRTYRAIF
ncbi:MAG TPA: transporter, partial [Gemmatimonadales bacterium]